MIIFFSNSATLTKHCAMNFWKVLFIFALIRGSFSNLKLTSKMNDSNLG